MSCTMDIKSIVVHCIRIKVHSNFSQQFAYCVNCWHEKDFPTTTKCKEEQDVGWHRKLSKPRNMLFLGNTKYNLALLIDKFKRTSCEVMHTEPKLYLRNQTLKTIIKVLIKELEEWLGGGQILIKGIILIRSVICHLSLISEMWSHFDTKLTKSVGFAYH